MNNNQNNPLPSQTDENYCKFASETLLQLIIGFEEQINCITEGEEDIEYVHKARVSSRRLRAALPLFRVCLPPNEFKEWTRQIKKVTSLLAQARDLDVQIAFTEKYRKKLISEAEKQAIDSLIEDQKDTRKKIQPSIITELENLKKSNALGEIREFSEKTAAELSNISLDPEQILAKSYWHISFRLDDFLSMEKYVYRKDEKQKHHRMRIFAKKLRYTLEIFAPLYKNNLNKQIETIKTFQDTLGEMHDSDVWIDYLPKFINKYKTKIIKKPDNTDSIRTERVLLNFSDYVKQRRTRYYEKFVHLWDLTKKSGLFIKLRKIIDAGLQMPNKKKQQILTKPNVKIALISDIHANLHALQKVIEDAQKRGADIFVNAGDSIGFGPFPKDVVELLCEKNVLSVLGNYDLEVIEGKAKAKGEKGLALKFARKALGKSVECYLNSLPHELRLEVAGKKLLVTHGSPESIEEHLYRDTPIEHLTNLADTAKADVIITGHSHEQFWTQADAANFVNPGSVGRANDGNPQAAYAVLSFNPVNVELIRLDYDVDSAANALRKKGLPESFSQMLLRGVSLDKVIEDDEVKEELLCENCEAVGEKSKEISKKYWPDPDHYLQVSMLSLRLFDELANLHRLKRRERCWLECAAILHDIGLSKAGGSHHKKTAKLILNDAQLPFSSNERRIIASIARYHRKGLPKQQHYNLASLDRETVQTVKTLASLLRVADGLDCSHQSIVKGLNVKAGTKKVTVECLSDAKSRLEEQAFNKKKDLFEKIFAKKMVLIWKQQPKPLEK